MIIPGIIIAVLTFPGVIVHEAAHMLFCKLRRIPVLDVKFFQFDMNTTGYVVHGDPKDFTSTFLISIGPFFLNTLLCVIICFPAALPYYLFNESNFISIFLIWLGVSIGMHAFPSTQDASVLWEKATTEAKKFNILAILSLPIVVLIFIANALKFIWFDAIYGAFIGIFLPGLIFKNLL
ncbi:MAG: hypothetical protein A2086_15670 [Spirochaetes bacterium GWD1_27_9]|nr:MAG: hypothetical protein A2Z98_14175 [Spirochaetes bacterium GWB1_27_13]OHD22481.1 MAG: hypothetical protein A2Y34_06680 [Spirochaetes bacterium GWC1_27_15]OHD42820.1 MAG: hypothetical protein A2086_15670 [Spirochaetes bacterium GWD1_27_9]